MSRKIRSILYASALSLAALFFSAAPEAAHAQVGGTMPTKLTTFAPRVLAGGKLEMKAALTRIDGTKLPGLGPIEVYALYQNYWSRLGWGWTDNGGIATFVVIKPPIGTVLGWSYAGNGAYARPLQQQTSP